MSPVVAHRVNSRQRSTWVAFGAKRTLTEPRAYRERIYEYASSRSRRDALGVDGTQAVQLSASSRELPGAVRPPHPPASSGWPSIRHGTGGRRARNPREMAGTSQAASEARFRGKPITSHGALPSLPSRG